MTLRRPQIFSTCNKCLAFTLKGVCTLGYDNGHDGVKAIDTLAPKEECPKPRTTVQMNSYLEQ